MSKCKTCGKRAIFGLEKGIGLYCKKCRPDDTYVDVKNKKCEFPGCTTRANYGIDSQRFCVKHKGVNDTDIFHKKCKADNCPTRPSYGKVGGKPEYCFKHKPDNYVDVVSRFCKQPNCLTRPAYGKPDSKIPEYCVKHKPDDYVNVTDKKCSYPDCKVQASYGDPQTRKAEYCVNHKKPHHKDVHNHFCETKDCSTRATFGDPITKIPQYCYEHKPIHFINVKDRHCLKCNKIPAYGIPGYSPEYCATHKTVKMVREPTKYSRDKKYCTVCWTEIHYNNSEQICDSCSDCIRTGKTILRQRKELHIRDLFDERNITYIHDKPLLNVKYRPDFLLPNNIIVEVDEFQHKAVNCQAEIDRMKLIVNEIGPVLFIRYNPDTYKPFLGEKQSLEKREEVLLNTIEHELKRDRNKSIEIMYLFYDGYTEPIVDSIN